MCEVYKYKTKILLVRTVVFNKIGVRQKRNPRGFFEGMLTTSDMKRERIRGTFIANIKHANIKKTPIFNFLLENKI